MRNTIIRQLSPVLLGTVFILGSTALGQSPAKQIQAADSIPAFWEKFKTAIIKGDKVVVAGLSRFPIEMPYGMAPVRTKAQLIRRYRNVFNNETNAAQCFETAQPQTDPTRLKEFTVGCKNEAGDEVIIYSFTHTRNGWRFSGLDNINE